jgi:tetratricopeptide (TPR) repeat protein
MSQSKPRKLSRQQVRDLDVEISFLEGLLRRDPAYVDALELLGDDYSRRGRHTDTLRVDEQIHHLRPADPNALFNLACSLALTSQPERALHELERALDLGYRDFKSIQRDPDLASVRKHSGYRRLRAKIRTLKAAAI